MAGESPDPTEGAAVDVQQFFATLTDVHWSMSGEVVLMTLLGGLGTISAAELRRGQGQSRQHQQGSQNEGSHLAVLLLG